MDRDMATVADAIRDDAHALGGAPVGEWGDGCINSGYGCFAVRRDGVDGLSPGS